MRGKKRTSNRIYPKTDLPEGICNLCGFVKPLNYEHVPPQAAMNGYRFLKVTADEYWYGIHQGKKIGFPPLQGGHGIYSLCKECNSRCGGDYGKAFVNWSRQGYENYPQMKDEGGLVFFNDIRPLRILKQVASMFVAMSMNHPTFRERHMPLVEFVYNKESRWLPPIYRFWVYYVAPGPVRITASLAGVLSTEGKGMYNGIEIAYPPFGYVMTFDKPPLDAPLTEITGLKNYRYWDRTYLVTRINKLPCHGPMMGDYRRLGEVPERKLDEVRYIIYFGPRDENGELWR